MNVEKINWGQVGPARPAWADASGQLWAIWPSPVDHDACFAAAGFNEMADTDAAWDDDFSELLERLLTALKTFGEPRLVEGEYPCQGRRVSTSLREALFAAATNDHFPPCIVSFGEPAQASVRTSDGHPILWLWTSEALGIDRLLTAAAGLPVREAALQWDALW